MLGHLKVCVIEADGTSALAEDRMSPVIPAIAMGLGERLRPGGAGLRTGMTGRGQQSPVREVLVEA